MWTVRTLIGIYSELTHLAPVPLVHDSVGLAEDMAARQILSSGRLHQVPASTELILKRALAFGRGLAHDGTRWLLQQRRYVGGDAAIDS